MKKIVLVLLVALSCFSHKSFGQKINSEIVSVDTATRKTYNALYIINNSAEKKMKGVIRNINNALNDPRLKGNLHIELVAFGDGVEIFKKSNHLDTLLLALKARGVVLAQCENTIRERKISKSELWPFISFVPSGNGEIIVRHYQGWATIHP